MSDTDAGHSPAGTPAPPAWAQVALLGLDIDGTLTDGSLYWLGPELGWGQRYAVRDGEAIVRLARSHLPVVPISRNKTACARARMQALGLLCTYVGIDDKLAALDALCAHHHLTPAQVCYVGDGREDAPILAQVGVGVCVADGHPEARGVANYVTHARGGHGAAEEVIERLVAAKGWQWGLGSPTMGTTAKRM